MAAGMDRRTGKAIDEIDHIQQSIGDILSTRIGTRVERRGYGSNLPSRIDDPVDQQFRVHVQYDVAVAIRTWETRVTAERVQLIDYADGKPVFRLNLRRRRDGAPIAITV
ncbi:GPW/gp25 family protein [Salinisphaera orenii]|uniref:GPW/gp25 family protein n=1 Tax=Salinisphaera orenii TaxID=856731 RepID=UPI000DBEA283